MTSSLRACFGSYAQLVYSVRRVQFHPRSTPSILLPFQHSTHESCIFPQKPACRLVRSLALSHRFLIIHPPCSSLSTFTLRFNRHNKGQESCTVRLVLACTLSKTLIPHARSRMHALAPTPTHHQQAVFTIFSRSQSMTYLLSVHPFSALILNQLRHQIPRFRVNPRKYFFPCLTGELHECHFAPVGEMFGFLQCQKP